MERCSDEPSIATPTAELAALMIRQALASA